MREISLSPSHLPDGEREENEAVRVRHQAGGSRRREISLDFGRLGRTGSLENLSRVLNLLVPLF